MNYFQYLMGHLPVIGRDVILENLRVVRGAYSKAQNTVRDLEQGAKKLKFDDVFIKGFNTTYMSAMTEKHGAKNFIEHYSDSMPNVIANMTLLEDVIVGSIEESLATKAATYKNTTLLQLTEACDFALTYGLTMINHVLLQETRLIQLKNGVPEEELEAPTAEPVLEKLQAHAEAFTRVMAILSVDPKDTAAALDQMPEVLVSETNYHTLSKSMGETRLDPMNLQAVANFSGSPILYWGRRRVEKQNAKYRLAQETIQCLKLRKLNLERALAGKQDAALERQIRATQSRIDELQRQIEEMESK